MSIRWNKRPTDLPIAVYGRAIKDRVLAEARASKFAMEAAAIAHAPWTDDTGVARGGLIADVIVNGQIITITLSHSVEYGQFLELKWPKDAPPPNLDGFDIEFMEAGKYAIIWPTIEAELPVLREALQKAVNP